MLKILFVFDVSEKGFCMRGDMCPFDHGSDPVVVEDVNLPGILPFPAQPPVVEGPPPPGLPPPPPILSPPPVNLRPPVPPPGPLPPSLPPVTGSLGNKQTNKTYSAKRCFKNVSYIFKKLYDDLSIFFMAVVAMSVVQFAYRV